jgi:hypothetical protein
MGENRYRISIPKLHAITDSQKEIEEVVDEFLNKVPSPKDGVYVAVQYSHYSNFYGKHIYKYLLFAVVGNEIIPLFYKPSYVIGSTDDVIRRAFNQLTNEATLVYEGSEVQIRIYRMGGK